MRKYLETTALASMMLASLLPTAAAFANPVDGVVSAGAATITETGKNLDIHQSTDKAVIDWRSFDIAPDEKTQFYQPNSGSITLNRINSGNPSQIMGSLVANGNVVIVNGSGVLFGKDAKVDVNGLVATSSNISNANFMAGNLNFDTPGNANASVINQGTITAKQAGLVGLVAPNVSNSGVITAKLGKVQLESGDRFSLDLYGDGLMNVTASDAVQQQLVEHTGTINAEGGTIVLAAATGAQEVNSLVNIEGELTTASATQQGGKIIISGDIVSHTGTIDASGTKGGSVKISANKIANQGTIKANGSADKGGNIDIAFKKNYLDTQQAKISATGTHGDGGSVSVVGDTGSNAFISSTTDVSSSTGKGGNVAITAKDGDLKLYGANVNADGKTGGGKIAIGGDFQGGGTLAHTATTGINYATTLSANALDTGTGGNIVIWSDETTKFGGHVFAKGGAVAGDGGQIEISSKDTLQIAGNAETNASATNGQAGNLLLDPKNIIVAAGGINGGISSFELLDPNPSPTNGFGGSWTRTVLSNNNVLLGDESNDFMATDGGAVYLFNGATGALISALYGNHAGAAIGSGDTYELANGNYLLANYHWNDGVHTDVGAVTWGSGTTGISGVVGASNSLIGSQDNDMVGLFSPTFLSNGNYVITNPYWDNGAHVDAGFATWGDGATGSHGVISAANSLVGTNDYDQVGYNGVIELKNGNYVIVSSYWGDGVHTNMGAVTWANGTSAITGTISAANSFVGSHDGDVVGNDQVLALSNGNYVIASNGWNDGVHDDVGAITWGDGATGSHGVISASNSLVGSHDYDWVGFDGLYEVGNSNYVGASSYWGGSFSKYGAVSWGNGLGGTVGVVDSTNSLLGSYAGSEVGRSIAVLSNGNYVASTAYWTDGVNADLGAVSWLGGNSATHGYVDSTNSLVGAVAGDQFGYIVQALENNGNYIILSPHWSNGGISDAGAATWADGTVALSGVFTGANSMVGSHVGDEVGINGGLVLTNGNFVVNSTNWGDGVHVGAGAFTWMDGTAATTGVVSAANSIVGSHDNDNIGGIYLSRALSNGNYVVLSPTWDDGTSSDVGAITWGNGMGGTHGVIDATNSLVGSHNNENIGGGYFQELSNSGFVISDSSWSDGVHVSAGAVVWGSGIAATSGVVSAATALVGSHDYDNVGDNTQLLSNGNYVVLTPEWNAFLGAITWGSGTAGVHGLISAANSVVGSQAGDGVGNSFNIVEIPNGTYAVASSTWDNGTTVDAGAITFLDSTAATSGYINASNSFIGANAGDALSFAAINAGSNNRVIVGTSTQHVYSVSAAGGSLGSYDSYGDQSGSTVTLDPAFITAVLNAGTAVTLQASNDITINDAIIANNGSGDGGALTLQAGRSIFINDDIFTDNGNLNIFANERSTTGVVNAQRDAGNAVISMASGVQIDTGTGDVVMRLDTGAGNTNHGAGAMTLTDITANTIFARNFTGDIILDSGALTASATSGDSIILASGRNFINNAGASVLNLAGTSRWLLYSTKAADNTYGGLVAGFSLDACAYGNACGTSGAGNGFLYSFNPNTNTGGSTPDVPNTVLYVSQTPVDNLVSPPAAPGSSAGNNQPVARGENKQSYLVSSNDKNGAVTYSLFNGWITIAPELVQLLGLDKVQI